MEGPAHSVSVARNLDPSLAGANVGRNPGGGPEDPSLGGGEGGASLEVTVEVGTRRVVCLLPLDVSAWIWGSSSDFSSGSGGMMVYSLAHF